VAVSIVLSVWALTAASVCHARGSDADWPSYNRTATADRHADLDQVNLDNVARLKVLCTFKTGVTTNFETGLVKVGPMLYATTAQDTFALDPSTCKLRWYVHDEYNISPRTPTVNRGVAYDNGRLFRGTQDGRVLAYDALTGKRLWETHLDDPGLGATIPAAPVAWNGLVFVGNAGGELKAAPARMYALAAADGKVIWQQLVTNIPMDPKARGWDNAAEVPLTVAATWTSWSLDTGSGLLYISAGNPTPDFERALRPDATALTNSVLVLDARTGAYRGYFPIVPADLHGYGTAAAPVLFTARSGKHLLTVASRDGYLRTFDLSSGRKLYDTPVTTLDNQDIALAPDHPLHLCPGPSGGTAWNGPAVDPARNLIFTGAVDWCTTVTAAPSTPTRGIASSWTRIGRRSPPETDPFGTPDPVSVWAGWVYATDADSGRVAWKFKAPAPILSGVTPTRGGLVFVGDVSGQLYALSADSGLPLWSIQLDGALGGGVITYQDSGAQRIAVVTGMSSPPVGTTPAQVVVLGL
jgi:alcohol dehydrogenase (cytochrome c)